MFVRHSALLVASVALLFAVVVIGCEKPADTSAATTSTAAATPTSTASADDRPPLLVPKKANAKAPDKYKAKFTTTKGDFVIEVTRDWAPRAADRLYNLIKVGYYTDVCIHRVAKDFVVQFGIHGDPKVNTIWRKATIIDEMVKESNKAGTVTFARSGADSRTTQIFINLKDNSEDLDGKFPPFGKVVEGMKVIESFYSGYADQTLHEAKHILEQGNKYAKEKFPKLDYIKSASVL